MVLLRFGSQIGFQVAGLLNELDTLTACDPEKTSFHIPASARMSNLVDICSWSTMSLETDHRSSLSLTPCCHHSSTSGEPEHVKNPRETQPPPQLPGEGGAGRSNRPPFVPES